MVNDTQPMGQNQVLGDQGLNSQPAGQVVGQIPANMPPPPSSVPGLPGFKQAFVPAVSAPELNQFAAKTGATFNEGQVDVNGGLDFDALERARNSGNGGSSPRAGILQGNLPVNEVNGDPSEQAKKSKVSIKSLLKNTSSRKLMLAGVGLLLLVVIVILGASLLTGNKDEVVVEAPVVVPQKITLEYWGLWEPDTAMKTVLRNYEQKNNITISYVKQDIKGYRQKLQTAIDAGNGPDIYRFHLNWVPMMKKQLAVLPEETYSLASYKETFYPVAVENLSTPEGVLGVPLMYDGLALVYNKDLIKDAEVPKSWGSFINIARKLTTRDATGKVIASGAAIGLAHNIDHFSDLVGWLALETGVDLTFANASDAANDQLMTEVLSSYTDHYLDTQNRLWDEHMPNSLDAFAEGRVAMIFVPSYRLLDLKKMNPNLNVGVAALPTWSKSSDPTWASFWVEGVNSKSSEAKKVAAGKLLKYLSSADIQQSQYQEFKLLEDEMKDGTVVSRPIGEIYSRKDIADALSTDKYVQSILSDAKRAETFYLTGNTWDEGLNDDLIKYYEDAINSLTIEVVKGGSSLSPEAEAQKNLANALRLIKNGTAEIWKKYAIGEATVTGAGTK